MKQTVWNCSDSPGTNKTSFNRVVPLSAGSSY